jgi:hypothetical protein
MSKQKVECRAYAFDVGSEEIEGKRRLTGRPIVFSSRTNLGPFDEIIEPGALDNTDLRDVRFLVNHNVSMIPLARSRNNNENSTMQLMPVADGMDIRVDIDVDNNMDARALSSAVDRGDITGMSFMMVGIKDRWENPRGEHPTRHIVSIGRVLEVSAVTFPAYDDTSIELRANSEALDSAMESLDSAKAVEEQEERTREEKKRRIMLLMEVNK